MGNSERNGIYAGFVFIIIILLVIIIIPSPDNTIGEKSEKNITELSRHQNLAIQCVQDIVYIYDTKTDTCYAVILRGHSGSEEIREVPYEKYKDQAIVINNEE